MQDPSERDKKRGSGIGNWIGVAIFLLIAFGSQIIPPLARFISQATGITINQGMLIPILVIGLLVLSVVVSLVRSAINTARRNEIPPTSGLPPVNLPSPTMPSSSPYQRIPSPPTAPKIEQYNQSGSDFNSQRLPSAPQFEPIINPKVLGFGILGVLLVAGVMGIVAFLTGAIP